jgi:hypothetical protein
LAGEDQKFQPWAIADAPELAPRPVAPARLHEVRLKIYIS